MIFQGDVSKYHPADALMFLSQLSLSGVLSVAYGQQILTLSFNAGRLLDAQSAAGDAKMVAALRFQRRVTQAQEERIRQVQQETGMPVRQVLGELDLFPLAQVKTALELGISEVLLELFMLDEGQFHFTDTPVDPDTSGIKLDTAAAAIRILSHADEMRNFQKAIVSLDRRTQLGAPAERITHLPAEEQAVAQLAVSGSSVRTILDQAPLYRHRAMRITEKLIADGILILAAPHTNHQKNASRSSSAPAVDPLFGAYKQAFKMLIGTEEVLKKLEAVIGFCKNFYDGILILTARGQQVIHCKRITIDPDKNIGQKTIKGDLGTIDQDPMLQAVQRTGIGFFGKAFPSPILDRVTQMPPAGECALLPVVIKPQLSMFFYASCVTQYPGLSPHHYLELLSWLLTPSGKRPGGAIASPSAPCDPASSAPAESSSSEVAARLVAQIEDLPSLPAMATRTLQLLSDPETAMETVEKTLAQDQALVARIIKVSNSALYGGYQKANTLRQALTRLGAKTTKSLILAASARSYFFKERRGLKMWGPQLWQHSVECGFAARRIAAACRYEDPEQAFIGGIMHDIGKLAILMLDDKKFMEIQRVQITENITDLAAEAEILGSTHTQLGRLLMEKWRMPEAVQACTQFHHDPDRAGSHRTLSAIVAYANRLSHTIGGHPQTETQQDAIHTEHLMQIIGLSSEQCSRLSEKVCADFENNDMIA